VSIVVRGVSKSFGAFPALTDVSLEVARGSLTALLGPSGSGKSTLLRIIAGLERPDSGEILISGSEATSLKPQKRNVGFVFQHYAAFKHMTVRQNVAFGLEVRKRPKHEVRERVDRVLRLVQLDGLAGRYPAQLSGGQRQRMALARALAPEPEVLLLDEPFGALDARVRGELREWLRRLHDEMHVTTIFVTHDQAEAMDVADQIAVMNRGRIEQVGAAMAIYDEPATEFVMRFVGEANRLGDTWVRPHDLAVAHEPWDGGVEAMIRRVSAFGFDARLELEAGDGSPLAVQLTRERLEELELEEGQIVWVRPLAPSGGTRHQIRDRRRLEHAAHRGSELDPDVA
jgi:sulfate transport system ATP-binding protein